MGGSRKLSMTLRGDYGGYPGHFEACTLRDLFSPTALDEMSDYIMTLTKANLSTRSRIVEEFFEVEAPAVGANMDEFAVMVFKNRDTGAIFKLFVPAPMAGIIYEAPSGSRVLPEVVEVTAEQINLNTSINCTGKYGYIATRRPGR